MLRLNSLCDGTGNQFDHDRESIRGKQGINCDNRESIPFAAMKHLFRAVSSIRAGRSRAPLPPIITAPTRRQAGAGGLPRPASAPLIIRRMPPFCKPSDDVTEQMGEHSSSTARRPRADAVRNRELVLEAAKSVFSAGGPDASLEAVARRAGVGIGTLYRHFPTREALFEAVYRREVEHLADLAQQLKADDVAPTEALRRWLRSNVEFVATKKGMSAALALAANKSSELSAYSFARLTEAVGALLDRAIAAGEIRADISPEDVLRALVGMCYMHDQPGWQASVLRLVEVFVDGLSRPARGKGC
jgi:AcrR family transcriptional regulator